MFSIATANPSLALILTSTKSLETFTVSPATVISSSPFASSSATNSAASSFASSSPNCGIFFPRTGPASLKLGFSDRFMYSPSSSANTTFLTLSSSITRSVRSATSGLYLPSTRISLSGCLTLILSFSRAPRPRVTKLLTRFIRSSTLLSMRASLHSGKYAVCTVSSPVSFVYISSEINGANGAIKSDTPTNTSKVVAYTLILSSVISLP